MSWEVWTILLFLLAALVSGVSVMLVPKYGTTTALSPDETWVDEAFELAHAKEAAVLEAIKLLEASAKRKR